MDKIEFKVSRKDLLDECFNIVESKNRDYSKGDEDFLNHFNQGVDLGISPIKVCGIFLKKQTDAIMNYIKVGGEFESEPIRERIKDSINYLVFLNCLIEEKEKVEIKEVESKKLIDDVPF